MTWSACAIRSQCSDPMQCSPEGVDCCCLCLLCAHVASLADIQAAQPLCSEDEHMLDFAYGPDAQPADVHERSLLPLLRKLVEGYNTAAILFGASGMSAPAARISPLVCRSHVMPQHDSVPAAAVVSSWPPFCRQWQVLPAGRGTCQQPLAGGDPTSGPTGCRGLHAPGQREPV